MIYTKLREWLPDDLYSEYVDIIKASPKTKHTAKRWHFDNCKSGRVQQGD